MSGPGGDEGRPKLVGQARRKASPVEDPFLRWERLNRLVSQLQLTHEQTGLVIARLADEVEALRPERGRR